MATDSRRTTMTTQARTLANCNMRQEPNVNAAIAATLKAGAIVHADMTRISDGWVPVQIVNGWISGELLEAIE